MCTDGEAEKNEKTRSILLVSWAFKMALCARWLCAFWILVVASWASHEENIDLVGSGDSLFARIAADVQPFYDTAHGMATCMLCSELILAFADTSRTELISDLTDRTSRRLSRRHGNVGERQGNFAAARSIVIVLYSAAKWTDCGLVSKAWIIPLLCTRNSFQPG